MTVGVVAAMVASSVFVAYRYTHATADRDAAATCELRDELPMK